jgi:hypothetical protein
MTMVRSSSKKKRSLEMSPLIDFRKIAISLALFAVVGFWSGVARADTVYVLGNANFGGYPSPYGSVNVHLVNSTTATLTFTADQSHAGYTYLFGNGGTVAANFNGAVTLSGAISANLSEGGVNGLTQGVAGNEDGFGDFSFTVNNTDGYQDAIGGVTFTVTLNSGTWADSAHVLTANANGNVVAAHIFICGVDPCNTQALRSANPALKTGFVTNGTNPPVPEPASMFLLGSGLVGLAAGLRRRFRK